MPCVRREILRARHVDLTSLHLARHSRVGLRAQLPRRHRGHLLDALENDLGADATVETDDVCTPLIEAARDLLDAGAVGCVAVFTDGHLRDDRGAGTHVASSQNRLLDFVERRERLEDENVSATLLERRHLLPENFASLVERSWSVRL